MKKKIHLSSLLFPDVPIEVDVGFVKMKTIQMTYFPFLFLQIEEKENFTISNRRPAALTVTVAGLLSFGVFCIINCKQMSRYKQFNCHNAAQFLSILYS